MFQNTKRVRGIHDKSIPAGCGGMDMTIFEIAIELEVSDLKPSLLRSKEKT